MFLLLLHGRPDVKTNNPLILNLLVILRLLLFHAAQFRSADSIMVVPNSTRSLFDSVSNQPVQDRMDSLSRYPAFLFDCVDARFRVLVEKRGDPFRIVCQLFKTHRALFGAWPQLFFKTCAQPQHTCFSTGPMLRCLTHRGPEEISDPIRLEPSSGP